MIIYYSRTLPQLYHALENGNCRLNASMQTQCMPEAHTGENLKKVLFLLCLTEDYNYTQKNRLVSQQIVAPVLNWPINF